MSNPAPEPPEIAAAVCEIEDYWASMARTWPWMLQQSLRPVYVLIGELLIDLTRAFPAMIASNQSRWYARQVQGTPSVYVLFPDQFQDEARKRIGSNDPRALEGKNAITFIYLATVGGQQEVAKTLLTSTAQHAPMFRAQVAHELLNCACATSWDGRQMRAGVRLAHWQAGMPLQTGGMLNDLLIDALLSDFLPAHTTYTRASLAQGPQGPYWRIVAAFAERIPAPIIQAALFGPDAAVTELSGWLNEAFERGDAARWLDQLIADRKWDDLSAALGVVER